MACIVTIGEENLQMNNRSFDNAITFAIETARSAELPDDEAAMLERFAEEVDSGAYWPGRGIDIAEDFPNIDEQKFWARIYIDTARAVMDGEVGSQTNDSWKPRMIYLTYAIGRMFATAVRLQQGSVWWPDTKDAREEKAYRASLAN